MVSDSPVSLGDGAWFDRAPHHFSIDGARVPSITQAIETAGLGPDLSDVPEYRLVEAAQRGTHLHAALQYALEDDLAWEDLEPAYRPVTEAAVECLREAKFEMDFAERPLVSHRYRFGGIPDLVGRLYGSPAIVEVKTPLVQKLLPVALQLSGGTLLARESNPKKWGHLHRFVLKLDWKNFTARLVLVERDPFEDEANFLAAVRRWHCSQDRDLHRNV